MITILKKILIPAIAAIIAAPVTIAQTVNESVRFTEKIHNFGTIGENDGKVTHRFVFTNTGRDTVTLIRARAGCSCVHAEVSKRPVLPGAKGYVDVTYDPDYRPGHFSKEVVVFSNGNRYNRIWVKGDVTPGTHPLTDKYRYDYGHGLLMNYKVLNFGNIPPATSKTHTIGIANNSGTTLHLIFRVEPSGDSAPALLEAPEYILDIPERYLLKPGAEGEIPVTLRILSPLSTPAFITVTPIANGFPLTPFTIVAHPESK